jgi:uncharacterized protein (TIGR02147 family)
MGVVFEYSDYREFLRGAITDQRQRDPSFTYRFLNSKLGLRSAHGLSLVVQGKRNLSGDSAVQLAQLLGLSEAAAQYFLWLVLFDQAATSLEKAEYWKQAMTLRMRNNTATITDSQYAYYSQWYHPVIRELVAMPGVQWDAGKLSGILRPKVPVAQVRRSLNLLEELGFLRREGKGWAKTSPNLATSPEVRSMAVFQYHQELVKLSKAALETMPGTERNFTSVTVELNAAEYRLIVDMLADTRRQVLAVGHSTGPVDQVYQLNLQLFPVSHAISALPQSCTGEGA